MSSKSDLSSVFSKRPIVLVVEDRVVKEYLYAVWGADQIHFTIIAAGGHQIVSGFVEDSRKHGITTIFGFVDTDFGTSNVENWETTNNPPNIFRSSYHEAENMLLDWDALEGCDLNQRQNNHNSSDIQNWAKAEAAKQPWWLACRNRLRDMQKLHGAGFPKAPKLTNVTSHDEAFAYIADSGWCGDLQSRTTQIMDSTCLDAELNTAHTQFSNDLASDEWKTTFSGKEIYRHLRSRIYNVHPSVSKDADVDLAHSVGLWQRENNKVPCEMNKLKDIIKKRVGIFNSTVAYS